MKHALIGLIALAAIPATAQAQLAPEGGPIDIAHADQGIFDRSARTARFRGSVDVRQARVSLKCDALDLVFAEAPAGSAPEAPLGAKLGPAERMECVGNVAYENPARRITADRCDYSARTRLITLSGNVTLTEAGRSLRGAQMTISPDTGAVTIRGAGGVFGGGN